MAGCWLSAFRSIALAAARYLVYVLPAGAIVRHFVLRTQGRRHEKQIDTLRPPPPIGDRRSVMS
jgi:hypothetical protein